ncbi:MAG: hypothetical protein HQ485_08315 [Acidobacteria bacterium]|nr:hypothetical protein [Acidobacteriota bacterium]
MIVRPPFRTLIASWTLVALVATGVSPVMLRAIAGHQGTTATNDHACCPETVRGQAPAVPTEAPPPCCAVGSTPSQDPASVPASARIDAASPSVVRLAAWYQRAGLFAGPPLQSTGPLGSISPLLRTSVLLI